jgi:hypothetical protein
MKCISILLALSLAHCCCGEEPAKPVAPSTLDAKLNARFEHYCDYTGNLGIGFVASDTYDYKFRQRLKATKDPELKRLFVLQHLYRGVGSGISTFEEGIVITGKNVSRKMTPQERASTRAEISKTLLELTELDPGDPEREIAKLRDRLSRIPQ